VEVVVSVTCCCSGHSYFGNYGERSSSWMVEWRRWGIMRDGKNREGPVGGLDASCLVYWFVFIQFPRLYYVVWSQYVWRSDVGTRKKFLSKEFSFYCQ